MVRTLRLEDEKVVFKGYPCLTVLFSRVTFAGGLNELQVKR